MQSWSRDGGHTWETASASVVDGAASKPALASFASDGRDRTIVLAYNVHERKRMALSTSSDGGLSWRYLATLDNGTTPGEESSDCYPTVIVAGEELLTVWSTYDGGPSANGFAGIKLARTALPTATHAH